MSSQSIACSRCRVVHSESEWAALSPVTEVDGTDLSGLVRDWPDELVVMVRACTCGTPIARLTRRPERQRVA